MSVSIPNPQTIDLIADARQFFLRRYAEYKQKNTVSSFVCWLLLLLFMFITVGSTTIGVLPISEGFLDQFAFAATLVFVLSFQLLNLQAVKFYHVTHSEVYRAFSMVVVAITLMFSVLLGAPTFLKVFAVEHKLNAEARLAALTDIQQSAIAARVNVLSAIDTFKAVVLYSKEQAGIESGQGGTCQIGVKGGDGPRTWFRNKFAQDAEVFVEALNRTQSDLDAVLTELANTKDEGDVLTLVGKFNGLVQAGTLNAVKTYSDESLQANKVGLYQAPDRFSERFFSCPDEKLQRLLSNVILALATIQPMPMPAFKPINDISAMQLTFDSYLLISQGEFKQVPTLVYVALSFQVFVDMVVIYLAKVFSVLQSANSVQHKLLNSRIFRRATVEQLINFQNFLMSNRSLFRTYKAIDVLDSKLLLQLKRLGLARASVIGTSISNANLSIIIDVIDYHIALKEGESNQ